MYGIFPRILIKTDAHAEKIEQRKKEDEEHREKEKLKEEELKKK